MSEFQGVDTRPLVAVSPAFEAMTGSWGGIGLGKNGSTWDDLGVS